MHFWQESHVARHRILSSATHTKFRCIGAYTEHPAINCAVNCTIAVIQAYFPLPPRILAVSRQRGDKFASIVGDLICPIMMALEAHSFSFLNHWPAAHISLLFAFPAHVAAERHFVLDCLSPLSRYFTLPPLLLPWAWTMPCCELPHITFPSYLRHPLWASHTHCLSLSRHNTFYSPLALIATPSPDIAAPNPDLHDLLL